ncbi:MAG: hypothetical protein KA764_10060 [Anaerolineales bacterium]|nr:hypothetical protein [Anaerolineales bacterium]
MSGTGRRGRPRLEKGAVLVRLNLRLRPGEDDDLIAFLTGTPARRRVQAVKIALRAGGLAAHSAAVDGDDSALAAALDGLLL